MRARLYGMAISHPANAARLMLEHKGIEHEVVGIQPGMQALRVRLAGFPGGTVPALKLDGRRVLGSLAISRALDEVRPDPPLFPRDPDARRAVQEAEAWGDRELQPVPRRLLRHVVCHDRAARLEFARMLGNPAPQVMAAVMAPVTAFYARREDAGSLERIRADWAAVPGHIDHVDALVREGVLHAEQLNAADFQIGTTLRVMLAMEDFAPLLAGRPAEALARRVWPDYPWHVPSMLPAELRAG